MGAGTVTDEQSERTARDCTHCTDCTDCTTLYIFEHSVQYFPLENPLQYQPRFRAGVGPWYLAIENSPQSRTDPTRSNDDPN